MVDEQISTIPLSLWSGSGLVIIDKPRGPSSHQVTAWVGKMLGCRVGHSGTLDPQVSGVLLIMLGNAVRLAPLMLKHEKEYVCLMRLHDDVPREQLEQVIKEFVGKIYQRPPRKSAVKRSLRIRTIYKIEILDFENRLVLFRVHCDAGTYIRSLCHHIGLALGIGAHMQELRRTRSGTFDETQVHTLHELKSACIHVSAGDAKALSSLILPVEAALPDIPRVVVRNSAIDAICHGAQLAGVGILMCDQFKKGETVTVLSQKNEFICLGAALLSSTEFIPGGVGLVIAPTTVFMRPGTYSQGWKKKRHEK
ncbi:MAG: RNA-guided pseudouridylation complex pseudouridine synthase subunit Cbf5 [Methanoregulaceae archaeon]|jgi:tRNA pseudouridine55 synthase/H/ACA ribonucleoprotein complex subunit 4